MSRIGKKTVTVPSGVKVSVANGQVLAEGPKGKLAFKIHPRVQVNMKENQIQVGRASDERTDRALHGMVRSMIQNMVVGVAQEFTKHLQIEGVGFKAQIQGKTLQLALGYSHPINYTIPDGVKVEAPKPTQLVVHGVDRTLVGQVAAEIRRFFEPEPYKGKGIRFQGEHIRKKQGKTVG